ncbi:hypothetical protein D9M71_252040 [compost metagenome]
MGAGGADLVGQLGHRGDGLLDHLTAVAGLLAGIGRVVRGVGGVAGDFLGGGAEFVDRRGNAVGAVGLLVGVAHRRVGGVHHQLRDVMQLARGGGDLADRLVNTLDEAVEGIGQRAEFVVAVHGQAAGQVAFALGDVLHGAAHGGQRLHQHAHQHAQQEDDGDDGDQRGDGCRRAELAKRGIGGVLVQRQGDVPGDAGQTLHRAQRDQLGLAVRLDLLQAGRHLRRALWINLVEALEHQIGIRVQEDLAGIADQEGIAVAVELQRVDDRGDGLQAHVAGGDAQQFAIAQHRYGHGEDLLLGAGVDERLGHHQASGGHRVLVPATGARIVAVRHGAVGAHGEGAGGSLAKVDRGEVLLQDLLFQHLLDRTGGGIAGGQLRRLAFHQMDATFQPDLDIAGGQGAEFGEIGLGILVDRLALPVVVEQDETGEGEDDDEGGCQEDLPGEGQRAKHG